LKLLKKLNILILLVFTIGGIALYYSPPPTKSEIIQLDDGVDLSSEISIKSDYSACIENGIKHYKEIRSYPRMSTGQNAIDVVLVMCDKNPLSF